MARNSIKRLLRKRLQMAAVIKRRLRMTPRTKPRRSAGKRTNPKKKAQGARNKFINPKEVKPCNTRPNRNLMRKKATIKKLR